MGPLHLKHLLHFPFLSCLPQLLLSLVEKLAHKSTVKYKNRLSFQIPLDNQVSIQQDATCLFSCQSDIETWNGKVSYAPNLTCNKEKLHELIEFLIHVIPLIQDLLFTTAVTCM
jgi:hypothetical protein